LADFTAKVQEDDAHPVHAWVGTHIDGWKDQLFNDEQWHAWLAMHVHDWLRTPTAEELVKTIWDKSRVWLDAAAQADSAYIEPLSSKIRDVILNTMSDADQQAKLTDKTAHVAANLLTEYQQDIRDWLTAQMNAWSKERLTGALENAIGRDLQYIRINGTLIGGLIGVFLYVVGRMI
jgi:uncharacterized membrane-anchored protein YjiN (DUF445 family)